MPQVPRNCNSCKYKSCKAMPGGVQLWFCSHRGGPDSDGTVGFIELWGPLPVWCPLKNGAENKVFSVILGRTKINNK
jgi:hypothetical protein